jgi:hypothetical protein
LRRCIAIAPAIDTRRSKHLTNASKLVEEIARVRV